jgi:hypothetical protein
LLCFHSREYPSLAGPRDSKGELKFAIATSPFVSHLRVRVCHYSATHERDVSYGAESAVEAASSMFGHII